MRKMHAVECHMLLILALFMLGFFLYSSNMCYKFASFHIKQIVDPVTNITSISAQMRILIGVLTTASKFERRNLLRMAYRIQSAPNAQVTLKFVLGRPRNEEERTLVAVEMLHFHDILLLDCAENMNSGKTYYFFHTLAKLHLHHDYVMKVDDDSYVRIANLASSLQQVPREDLYYGYVLPCENTDPYVEYMAGMGYVVSWDLVEWIANSSVAMNYRTGTEDLLVGKWLNEGGKAKTRINKKPLFYDHPDFGGKCAHNLVPETILVHQLKTLQRWTQVLAFFEKERFCLDPSLSQAANP